MASVAALKKNAAQYSSKGKYEEAVKEYRKLLKINDNDPGIHNLLGDIYLKMSKRDSALDEFERSVELYTADEFYSNAVAIAKKVLRLDNTRAEIYKDLGDLYAKQGLLSEAITNIMEYSARKKAVGAMDEVCSAYQKAIEWQPKRVDFRMSLSDLYIVQNKHEDAILVLKEVVDLFREQEKFEDAEEIETRIQDIGGTVEEAPSVAVPPTESIPPSEPSEIPSPQMEAIRFEQMESVTDEEITTEVPIQEEKSVISEEKEERFKGETLLSLDELDVEEKPKEVIEEVAFKAPPLEEEQPTPPVGDSQITEGENEILKGDILLPLEDMGVEKKPQEKIEEVTTEAPLQEEESKISVPQQPSPPAGEKRFPLLEGSQTSEGEMATATVEEKPGGETSFSFDETLKNEEGSEGTVESVFKTAPTDLASYVELGDMCLSIGSDEEAIEHFYTAADAYFKEGSLEKSREIYIRIAQLLPTELRCRQQNLRIATQIKNQEWMIQTHLDLGECLLERGEEKDAQTIYRNLLQIDSKNPVALERAGPPAEPEKPAQFEPAKPPTPPEQVKPTAPEKEEKIPMKDLLKTPVIADTLLEEFREGLDQTLDRGDYSSHYDLGITYKEMGLMNEAIEAFQKASEGEKENLKALEMLGLCYLEKGEMESAAFHLIQGIRLEGHSPEETIGLQYHLGGAYEKMGQKSKALEAYQAAAKVDPNFQDLPKKLASLQQETTGVIKREKKRREKISYV